MNVAVLGLKYLLASKARTFEEATKYPIEAQTKVLFEYIDRNKNTEYGRLHKFSSIRSVSDYQTLVPLCDSETIRTYINRMMHGEQNILTKDKVIFFGSTSGTTSAPKFIPSTRYSESKKTQTLDLWSYYIARDHPDVLDGKILAIISPDIEGYTEAGIPFGAESGHGYRNLSALVKHLYALPYEVFEIKDYDARYYSILRIGMEHNVTDIATLNPNTLALLCQKIEPWRDIIIEDIRGGALSAKFDIPDHIRKRIGLALRPNPRRAAVLRDIAKERGRLLPKYFWPDLKLIECWKAGTMKLYLKDLANWFGDVPTRDIGCLATEARSSIPISDKGAGGVLAVQTNFYEFIPKEDMGKKKKRILLCDALAKGREYFIIVTTPGGLYRYNIDDIIRVDGFFNRTPVIEFVQKGLSSASLAGEKLYESQVNEALGRVLDRTKLSVEFFCAVAEPKSVMTRYIFLAEFCGRPVSRDEKRNFLKIMEEELRRENREYEFCRNAQLLKPPVLKTVAKGEFENYRIKRVSSGVHDGQFKAPELTSDAGFQDNFRIEEEITLDTSTPLSIY